MEAKEAVKLPQVRMTCECGNDTFWLAGILVQAVCTSCGKAEPLGINAFTVNL